MHTASNNSEKNASMPASSPLVNPPTGIVEEFVNKEQKMKKKKKSGTGDTTDQLLDNGGIDVK